jgi:hypothetical protein
LVEVFVFDIHGLEGFRLNTFKYPSFLASVFGGAKYRFGVSHTSTFPVLPSGSPVPLRPVSGFPGLRLLWGLRHHGTRVL